MLKGSYEYCLLKVSFKCIDFCSALFLTFVVPRSYEANIGKPFLGKPVRFGFSQEPVEPDMPDVDMQEEQEDASRDPGSLLGSKPRSAMWAELLGESWAWRSFRGLDGESLWLVPGPTGPGESYRDIFFIYLLCTCANYTLSFAGKMVSLICAALSMRFSTSLILHSQAP